MKKRQKFKVRFSINYKYGKKSYETKIVTALSEQGAIDVVKWLKSNFDISIISLDSLGYVEPLIYEDRSVLGNY